MCVCVHAGKDANTEERHAVLKTSEQFIQKMNYPTYTQVNKLALLYSLAPIPNLNLVLIITLNPGLNN